MGSGSINGQKLLTVIVAAYNVEAFITECLLSVFRQKNIDAIHLLVVDDGSTDATLACIEALANSADGVHMTVFSGANRGVYAARNFGLNQVRTPYLTFLDADDCWTPDYSEKIIPLLQSQDIDLIEFNYSRMTATGQFLRTVNLVPQGRDGRVDINVKTLVEVATRPHAALWVRVFKSSLWTNLRFDESWHAYQDQGTLPKIFFRASVLYRLPDYLYQYRYRVGTITRDRSLQRANDFARNANEALDNCNGGPLDQFWFLLFYDAFKNVINLCSEIDSGFFAEARQLVWSLYRRYQAIAAAIPSPIPPEAFAHLDLHIYKGRVKFCARRTLRKWPWLCERLKGILNKVQDFQSRASTNNLCLPEQEELPQGNKD